MAFALLPMAPIIVSVIYGTALYREYMNTASYALTGFILLLLIVLAGRWLFSMNIIETCPDFLTFRGPVRRRVIPWESVLQASILPWPLGYTRLAIHTSEGVFKAYSIGRIPAARIRASVWQHLHGRGMETGLEPGDIELGFWEEVGDSIPPSPEWRGRGARVDAAGTAAIGAAFLAGAVYLASLHHSSSGSLIFMSTGALISGFEGLIMAEKGFSTAFAARVEVEGLRVSLLRGPLTIPWDKVIQVYWNRGLEITWLDGRDHTITVPYELGKAESQILLLAVIRRLRTSAHPQALPLRALPFAASNKE
jgi:hypothetical protein